MFIPFYISKVSCQSILYDAFHTCRNESIIHASASHLDEKAAEVVKTMLALSENKSNRLSPTTNAVSHNEIFQNIRQSSNIKIQVSLYSYIFHF